MDQIKTANRFVDSMLEAEGKLAGVKMLLDEKKSEVQQVLSYFADEQFNIIRRSDSKIKSEEARAIFSEYKNTLTEIVNQNKTKHEEYVNGIEFINKFEETFIVSVFGKVKSGKSYLGNYMMGNAFKNLNTSYDKIGDISVNVYDRGKLSTATRLSEMIDETSGQGFGVAATEATSTIQYFRIGGLTWFDTPGIGSITKENEELAEEYIKNSDLVIFSMNSDAAGTRQELSELKDLYEMNKPMIILLTQSDFVDYDCDDAGNIIEVLKPKTDKDRSDVENYVVEEIINQGAGRALELSGGKALTISTKLAVEALKSDPPDTEQYMGSNMEELVNRLIDITHGKAAELKAQNPKDRFNKLIDDLVISVDDFLKTMQETKNNIDKIKKEADYKKRLVIENVRIKARDIITEIVANESNNGMNGKNISGNIIADKVSDRINKIIVDECINGIKDLIPDIGSNSIGPVIDSNKINVSDLGEKIVKQSYKVELLKRRKVARGAFGKIKDFFDGGKYEIVTTTKTKHVDVSLGVNTYEVENQLLSQFEEICNSTLDSMIGSLLDGCVNPLTIIYNQSSELAGKAKKDLEKLKIK